MSYKDKVEALAQSIHFKPGVHTVRIEHDGWCSIYSGCGECNCDAVVSLEPPSLDPARLMSKGVKEMRQGHERYQKIGRNQPCPCGSGVKFKKCHGSIGFEA